MAVAMRRFGATRLGARALAGFSALLGMVLLAAMIASAVAQLTDHFGFSYEQGLLVISLIAAGSIVFFWMFPYLIPVIGTIRLLIFYFGTAAAVGW